MLRPFSLRGNRGSATNPAHVGSAEYPYAPQFWLGGWMNSSQIRHESCNYDKRGEPSLGVPIM